MKKIRVYLLMAALLFVLSGCKSEPSPEQIVPKDQGGKIITINETDFTVEQINTQIKNTLNNVLYYRGNDPHSTLLNQSLVLNKTLEYSLYYVTETASVDHVDVFPPEIRFVITNCDHPLSTKEEPLRYMLGIGITENGLQSDFCFEAHVRNGEMPKGEFLGNYTMRISEITPPSYEAVSDQWKGRAEAALRRYMDSNDFYAIKEKNLPAGHYNIYIKAFSASDIDSIVVFEHENGQVYLGQYYFIHDVSEYEVADLNKVELVENMDMHFKEYLDKLRKNAALSIKYVVKE